MNADMLFTNKDIITELWKHVTIDTTTSCIAIDSMKNMKKLSIVSKDFNTMYKKMSDIDKIGIKYLESDSLSSFIMETGKSVSKIYGYPISKFLPTLSSIIEKKITAECIAYDIHILYYWIVILVHAVNRNYNEILNAINKIDYKRNFDIKIVQLFVNLMAIGEIQIFGPYYSLNKYTLLRYLSIAHIILYSKNLLRDNVKIVEIVSEKQNMLINGIRDFEIYHPKKFCKQLIAILEK